MVTYLWNTGALAGKLAEKVRNETGIPIFVADHPVPQEFAITDSYDEGAAIIGGYIALCSERKLTPAEYEIVCQAWTGSRKPSWTK